MSMHAEKRFILAKDEKNAVRPQIHLNKCKKLCIINRNCVKLYIIVNHGPWLGTGYKNYVAVSKDSHFGRPLRIESTPN